MDPLDLENTAFSSPLDETAGDVIAEGASAGTDLDPVPGAADDPGGFTGDAWLGEIVARLEEDPDQCWPALESLQSIDADVRAAIIAALAAHRGRPGVRALLDLLGESPEPATRASARRALGLIDADCEENATESTGGTTWSEHSGLEMSAAGGDPAWADVPRRLDAGAGAPANHASGRIIRSLVTAVDGDGRGTIVISARDGERRRTAAFLCDVCRGVIDVVGEDEDEEDRLPRAGGLIEAWIDRAAGDDAVDVPGLAVRLLTGSLGLSGHALPESVRHWVRAVLGPDALPGGRPALGPGPAVAIGEEELPAHVDRVLDCCPSWLDRSDLARELAEEIMLREGSTGPDPVRDAGAYRYLFEHSLGGRLDQYARMLLWMAWLWHASEREELARSAFALAGQLADEQYAVPSHPFALSLTTRSLEAAQAELLAADEAG